ncbi:DivIVA domain-containing protein [Terrisporobacter sp.]|uniref:DivIVA domain-containing protein n=1 Tax=Terrisporobacter sp. TaxID=1965305 RepID=UPI0026315C80|nr:DivIVA domain-containing protein [Terrisporobacter sp.]
MITPVDIENKEFKKGFRGYNEEEVDDFLDSVKEDFENLYRENLDLKEKLKLYQEQVSRYKSIEETLNATLITAQTAAEDTCTAANKKARIIVEEAELKSKQIIEDCNERIVDLRKEYDSLVKEFKVFRNRFKSLIEDEIRNIDEIFYDVDEYCNEPFKQIDFRKNETVSFLAEDEAASALE